jgi:hypothetical protein
MVKQSGTKGVVNTRPGPGIDTSIDELAKGLASGTLSRRKALRWMGSALLGGVLASVPGVAWAAPGGNTACEQFCTEAFPPGPERGECTNLGARGGGPCFKCTPNVGCGPNLKQPINCALEGQQFNCTTCQCEPVPTCPTEPVCCCSCEGVDPQTGEPILGCTTEITTNENCVAYCEALGATASRSFGCDDVGNSGFLTMCHPEHQCISIDCTPTE